jgi:DNA-binding NarL/FixJ family response regulator
MAESSIVDRSIHILIIESDPVVLSGLITCLNRFSDLHVAEASETIIAQIFTDSVIQIKPIDVILLGLQSSSDINIQRSSLNFCQQVKFRFPTIPILLLAPLQDPDLSALFQLNIEGCCLRGSSIIDLVAGVRAVAAGQINWNSEILTQLEIAASNSSIGLRERLRLASLQQIETTLANLNASLSIPPDRDRLSKLDRLILLGRRRELNTARWLVDRLFSDPARIFLKLDADQYHQSIPQLVSSSLVEPVQLTSQLQIIFERIAANLQSGLTNLTPVPLEIDILRQDKKRELFYLILKQFEGMLDELRFSRVTSEQLAAKQQTIWTDLWASVSADFFGRYHTLSIGRDHIEIIPVILQDIAIVQTEIIAKIPQSIELLNYLLFEVPLTTNNTVPILGSQASEDRACLLLENLIVQMANAVMQPLLNRFGNLESIKSGFYDYRLLSSREIERFRNDLSWRYRIDRYIGEPQAIFESQYRLFIFTPYGIDRTSIYAPRPQELAQLTGIPLIVTLALETRDALSPRLKSASILMGSSVVYLLTEIIGRGIGLIGRGVIKGIGNIWQESNRK